MYYFSFLSKWCTRDVVRENTSFISIDDVDHLRKRFVQSLSGWTLENGGK